MYSLGTGLSTTSIKLEIVSLHATTEDDSPKAPDIPSEAKPSHLS